MVNTLEFLSENVDKKETFFCFKILFIYLAALGLGYGTRAQ